MMEHHSKKEDLIAHLTGTFIFAQGIVFLQTAKLISGGTAGLALLLAQLLPLSFGTLYFVINAPFYIMAWKRFGAAFSINTLLACLVVSLFSDYIPHFIQLSSLSDGYCALIGGLLMGIGLLILFRHRASLGGFNIFCLYLQDKFGWSVGKTQIVIDGTIVCTSCFYLPFSTIGLSVISAAILNVVLMMNHKPTRYQVNYG